MKRPRKIRSVVKWDAKGKAKIARDCETCVYMERVTARAPRTCDYTSCAEPDRVIVGPYAKVTDLRNGPSKRINKRIVTETRDYHFDCVPEHSRPLVRFLASTPWEMDLCVDGQPSLRPRRRFTSHETWGRWVDKHFPHMRKTWDAHKPDTEREWYQVGTNYDWCQIGFNPSPLYDGPVSRNP